MKHVQPMKFTKKNSVIFNGWGVVALGIVHCVLKNSNCVQEAVHSEGHSSSRAEEEGARPEQDVLPSQGYQLSGPRALARVLQVY